MRLVNTENPIFGLFMGLGMKWHYHQGQNCDELRSEIRQRGLKGTSMVKSDMSILLALDDVIRRQKVSREPSPTEAAAAPAPVLVQGPPRLPRRTPSLGQVRFARMLAAKPGATSLTSFILEDELETSYYLDRNRHLMR